MYPRYFDRQALAACWREALLAQAVLAGRTKGYRRHPQLKRFRAHSEPMHSIGAFLGGVADEAHARGYRFDRAKILSTETPVALIPVSLDQLSYEWMHLRQKLAVRSPEVAAAWQGVELPDPHPLFTVIPGSIAPWERPKE